MTTREELKKRYS